MRKLLPMLLLCVTCAAQQESPKERAVESDMNGPVRGTLRFDARPVTEVTRAAPSFWFRNEDTGEEAREAVAAFEGNRFVVRGLRPGKYGVQVTIDANDANSVNRPGDYYSWTLFQVDKQGKARIDVQLSRILHLLAPVDNNDTLPGWEEEGCEPAATVPKDVSFRWEPLGQQTEYAYEIRTIPCPYKDLGVVASGATKETSVGLALPSSAADQFYLMTLRGLHENRHVGILMTWGPNFLAWDYRFRVK